MPESATEWIGLGEHRAEPEMSQAMNFATAMPMFARNAAMMALLPPDALMAIESTDAAAQRRVRHVAAASAAVSRPTGG